MARAGRHRDALGQARCKVHQRIEAVIDWYRASDNAAMASTVFNVVEGRSTP